MRRYLLGIVLFCCCIKLYAQCDKPAIRTALTAAGCIELPSCESSCSMYFYNPQSMTGSQAQLFAESFGANLISVQTAAENTCIVDALNNNGFGGVIWIGLGDQANEGQFVWYDQSPVSYTNWNGGEPNNSGNEDCVQIFSNGTWNDKNCGTGNSSSIIEVSLCPEIKVSNDTAVCSGSLVSLESSDAILGSRPYTYLWSNGPTSLINDIIPTVNGSYSVTVTDRYSCSAVETVQVDMNPIPTINIEIDGQCLNEVIDFKSNISVASGSIVNAGWDFGDQNNVIGENATHQYSSSNTYTVTFAATSDQSCVVSETKSLSIYPVPTVQFSAGNVCMGTSIDFQDNSTTNGAVVQSYNWDFGDGSATQQGSTVSYAYSIANDYDVKLLLETDQGCKDSLESTISIFSKPTADFSYSTVCEREGPTVFTNNSTIQGGMPMNYSWDFGDGSVVSTGVSPTHSYVGSNDYQVKLTVSTGDGCQDEITKTVTVLSKPHAGFVADTVSGCKPSCIQFTDTSYDVNGSAIVGWDWKLEFGYNESSDQYPQNCYYNASFYTVGLIVENAVGCTDTLEVEDYITIYPSPTAEFLVNPQETKIDQPAVSFINNSSGHDVWGWDFGDGKSDIATSHPLHTYQDTGLYQIELIVGNSYGCYDTAYKEVNIKAIDNVFVPKAFSPNGDGKNEVLYVRGFVGEMLFMVFDRYGNKVFESTDKGTGWNGEYKGSAAIEGVYYWFLRVDVNGQVKEMKGDCALVR